MTPYIDWNSYDSEDTALDVLTSFDDWKERASDAHAAHVDLIVAVYRYEDYSGSAFVVYRDKRDGKVYEVTGGHCSCYGLEGQWSPEEIVVDELLNRPNYGYFGAEVEDKIRAALEIALRDEVLAEVVP